jgi:hypothetical protein
MNVLIEHCPDCGEPMGPFMYNTRTPGDYEFGLMCSKCGRRDY